MTNPFKDGLDQDTKNALIKAGINFGGSALAGMGNQQYAQFNAANNNLDAARQRKTSAVQNALTQKTNAFTNKMAQQDEGDTAAARMLGSSPLDFQNQRAEAARKQQMFSQIDKGALGHLGVHAGPFGGGTNYATQFGPSPEAEQQWWETQNMLARGRAAKPNMGKIYGGPGADEVDASVANEGANRNKEWEGQWNAYQDDQNTGWSQLIKEADADVKSAKSEAEKASKTSWWQKLLSAFGTFAPIAMGMFSPTKGTGTTNPSLGGGSEFAPANFGDGTTGSFIGYDPTSDGFFNPNTGENYGDQGNPYWWMGESVGDPTEWEKSGNVPGTASRPGFNLQW